MKGELVRNPHPAPECLNRESSSLYRTYLFWASAVSYVKWQTLLFYLIILILQDTLAHLTDKHVEAQRIKSSDFPMDGH